MAAWFNAYDTKGNSVIVEEYPPERALVKTSEGNRKAVRIATSTYIDANGEVYSTSQSRSIEFATPENIAWAKKNL